MNEQPDEKFYWLALKLVPGVGAKTFFRLLDRFGSPENVLRAPRKAFAGIRGVGEKVIENIVSRNFERDPEKELKEIEKKGLSSFASTIPITPKTLSPYMTRLPFFS